MQLSDIDTEIHKCNLCGDMIEKFPSSNTVSIGKRNDILILGEAPANNGWRKSGIAWYDVNHKLIPSGVVLQKLLNEINLKIEDTYFLEAIKCYPKNRKYLNKCSENCKKYLLKQLDTIKPKIVLPLGDAATKAILNIKYKKFSDVVGKVFNINGYKVIPIYHPSPVSPMSYKGNIEIFKNIKEIEKVSYMKYLKLVDGIKSNANGFEYKIGEVNVAENWNPKNIDPKSMGGFNFSVENKILRWVHRGDTVYDVEIPADAEVIDCSNPMCPHGIFRTNKIILTNPRKVTEDMVMDFYNKSELPIKTYYQCIVVVLFRKYVNVAKQIIKDKVNKNNIDECIEEFESYIKDRHDNLLHEFNYDDLWQEAKEIYDILLNIQKGTD